MIVLAPGKAKQFSASGLRRRTSVRCTGSVADFGRLISGVAGHTADSDLPHNVLLSDVFVQRHARYQVQQHPSGGFREKYAEVVRAASRNVSRKLASAFESTRQVACSTLLQCERISASLFPISCLGTASTSSTCERYRSAQHASFEGGLLRTFTSRPQAARISHYA